MVAFWKRWQHWLSTSDVNLARWLRAARDALLGEMPVLAAGTALFAIIATVPALAAVVAIYGIAVDPNEIERHLKGLETVMPAAGRRVRVGPARADGPREPRRARVSDRGQPRGRDDLGAQLGAVVDRVAQPRVSSARAAVAGEESSLMTLAMGAVTLLGLVVMFAILIALPALVAAVGLKGYHLVRILRWPLMLALVLVTLVLHVSVRAVTAAARHGAPRLARARPIATGLLVLVSWALSVWVDHIASYDAVYGTFGSLIVIMLWFYLSTIALVIGGFVNGELEREAGRTGVRSVDVLRTWPSSGSPRSA